MAILTGTCSWTDKTLVDSGWYGDGAKNAESRLAFYADRFKVVEVDSTYYSLPSEKTAELWAERTPVDFTFDIKAFRLLTTHPAELAALPRHLREKLPVPKGKSKLYLKDLPEAMAGEIWDIHRQALMPLHSAGKLGVVLFQFPQWFFPSHENREYLGEIAGRFPDFSCAVEFRHGSWVNEKNVERTVDCLTANKMPYVSVDEPQTRQSVPPVAMATSDISVVRFHGRRTETWGKPNVGVLERFKYDYSNDELEEWVPKIRQLAEESREVHALMNNCYGDFAVKNAAQLAALLK